MQNDNAISNAARKIPRSLQIGLLFGGFFNQFAWVIVLIAGILSYHIVNSFLHFKIDTESIISLIVVAVAIYAMVESIRRGSKIICLYKYGNITVGKLHNIESTSGKTDGNGPLKVTFEFITDDGHICSASVFTFNPKPEWIAYAFMDKRKQQLESIGNVPLIGKFMKSNLESMIPEEEKMTLSPGEVPKGIILFDPNDPTQSIIPIGMHGEIEIDEMGNIQVSNPGNIIITSLTIPFFVLAIHIMILASKLYH